MKSNNTKLQLTFILNPIFLVVFFLLSNQLYPQISIDKTDMPVPNDTFRVSLTTITSNDPSLTGEDYIWDFSSLIFKSQTVDTFVSVSKTSFLYQLAFNNSFLDAAHQATVASFTGASTNLGTIQLKNSCSFYKNTNTSFAKVGIGSEISGVPASAIYNAPELLYSFPLLYGNQDSSISKWSVSVPMLGYLGETINRKNFVDGWGTLKTPFGTFDVMRMKSIVVYNDSVYSDSLLKGGMALPVRIQTEYKWIGKGHGIPLLQIVKSGITTTVTYQDSIRKLSTAAINEKEINNLNLSLSPNPTNDNFKIRYNLNTETSMNVELFDITFKKSKILIDEIQSTGQHSFLFNVHDLGLNTGAYLLKIQVGNSVLSSKLIIY